MKLTQRILSVLLSAVLVSQMAVVVAFAVADGHTPENPIADASSCSQNVTHYISSQTETTLKGGIGTNYITAKAGDIVVGGTGTNIITINGAGTSVVAISNYKTSDKLIIQNNGAVVPTYEGTGTVSVKLGSTTIATLTGSSTQLTTSNVPATVTLLGSSAESLSATIDKTTVSLTEGSSAQTIATVTAKNAPAGIIPTYQWYKAGTSDAAVSGQTTATLSLVPTTAAAGSYYCVVSTVAGTAVSAMTAKSPAVVLTVTPAPVAPIIIGTQPVGGTVAQYGTLTLTTAVSGGTGSYTYQWKTSTGATIAGEQNATGTGATGATYTVPTATAGDFYYFCTISSGTADSVNTSVVKVTVTSCDATLSTITASGAASVNGDSTTAADYTAVLGYDNKNCNIPNHADTNHGKTETLTWSAVDATSGSAVAGITIAVKAGVANTATLTVDKTKLPKTSNAIKIKATSGSITSNVLDVTVTRSTGCTLVPGDISITSTNPVAMDFAAGDTSKTHTFTIGRTADTGYCDTPGHNHGVVWSLDAASAKWATIDAATGLVTVTRTNIPKDTGNVITVTATATGNNQTKTATATINVTRPKMCNKKITSITSINGDPTITVTTNTVSKTYTITPVYDSGICDFGDADHGAVTNLHKVKWSITTTTPAGVSLNADTGTLTLVGTSMSYGTSTITLQATSTENGAIYKQGTIQLIRNTSGGGSSSDDSSSNDAEWNDIYQEIINADSGDTIKANIGDNTEMPGYVFKKLKGKNITLKLSVTGGYTWTVNGRTMNTVPDYQIYIPLDVTSYSNSSMFKLTRDYDVKAFQLRHSGSFYSDMKLTIPVSSDYDNKTLYLYSYNESTNKLTYRSSAKADSNSNVTFTFKSSADQYVITSKALYGESAVTGGGGSTTVSSSKPAASTPAASSSSASSSSSTSSSSSSSSSSSAVSESSSSTQTLPEPESKPTDTQPEKEKGKFPILVPILIVAILGVIVAVILIAKGGSGKGGMTFDD